MAKYSNVSVETIYQDLITICKNEENVSPYQSYVTLRNIFYLFLDDKTRDVGFSFSGPFAKMDYLAKESHLSKNVFRALNHFRSKIRSLKSYHDDELRRTFLYDVRLFSEFVSCVCQIAVPDALLKLLPNDLWVESSRVERPVSEYIRVVVDHWNEQYIYAEMADELGDDVVVCYAYSTEAGDLTLNGKLLEKGVQLNLIRPKLRENIYYPEFIIYEPDFLVDISTVADAFEEYGLTPYSYLVKKLMSKKNTQAILIGNFASQLLDEAVYNEMPVSYSDSAKRFFQTYPMNLVTCSDFKSPDFHAEVQRQQLNLKMYTEKQLDGYRIFDPNKVLLEPSFFCEMLGVQGRMDLLTDDKKILIEQKSGKWGFPNGGHQEKHYVQMLFYLAWLKYNQRMMTEDVSCLLLYSKYPTAGKTLKEENGLIKEGPAPKLLFNALLLRNYIVWLEKRLEKGGITILNQLTAEHLNVNHTKGKLWNTYQKPEIESILTSIQKASSLEKAYFYRFYTFLEKEYHLAKASFASAWNLSMEEKEQEGMVYTNLYLISALASENWGMGVDLITFGIEESDQCSLPNFRKGDVVAFYAYKDSESPNMCHDIVYRATIVELHKEFIVLKLRAPQRNKNVFRVEEHIRWTMEHDFLDSSFVSAFKDLFSFISMENSSRKDLILNQRTAEVDATLTLKGDYGSFNELVLRAKQAQDLFIVIGPPGTGKTSYALVNILKESLLDDTVSVLIVSYTNRAVEEICMKLIKEGIDFVRVGHEHSCTEHFDTSYLLKNKIKELSNAQEIKNYLQSVRVYVGTTTSISSTTSLFALKQFDLAIVDEASQILEPHLIGLFTANNGCAVRKFVFIGDHKQLPAVVQQSELESRVEDEELQSIGLENCRYSFFERILKSYKGKPEYVYMLSRQGRMHPEISDFVNTRYYESMLTSVPLAHQQKNLFYDALEGHTLTDRLDQLLYAHRMLCFHLPVVIDDSSDTVNVTEAQLIAQIVCRVKHLYEMAGKKFDVGRSVGVIVPYRSQIAMVRKELEKMEDRDLSEISIDTVERYQGSERDVIIYGTTIKKSYQLGFLSGNVFVEEGRMIDRKLNVAITRAREQMIFIGDMKLLSKSPTYQQFIQYMKETGNFYGNPMKK